MNEKHKRLCYFLHFLNLKINENAMNIKMSSKPGSPSGGLLTVITRYDESLPPSLSVIETMTV